MRKKVYGSDISREQFDRVRSLLEGVRRRTKPRTVDLYEVFCGVLYLLKSGCQWRMLPGEFPKWRTVHAYWQKWSEPGPDGISVLERALKKIGWRGPRQTGAQLHGQLLDRGRAERQEHRYRQPEGL
jgi:transposase